MRLLRAPCRERRGPFAGPVEGVHPLAAADDAAIDQPGDDRRQLPGGRRDHRLVEEREPRMTSPCRYSAMSRMLRAKTASRLPRNGSPIAAAASAARCMASRSPALECRCAVGEEQVPLLGALAPLALDQPLGPRQPAGGPAGLAEGVETKAEPERGTRRPQSIAVAPGRAGGCAPASSASRRRGRSTRPRAPADRDRRAPRLSRASASASASDGHHPTPSYKALHGPDRAHSPEPGEPVFGHSWPISVIRAFRLPSGA